MPVFEFECRAETCKSYEDGMRYESYLPRWDYPDPPCPNCAREMNRLPALANAIWTKPYGQYGDKSKEGYSDAGIIAYRTNSSRLTGGATEKVYLETVQQVREYCKAEGLRDPSDTNPNAEIGSDGKIKTAGVKGTWL